MHEAPVVPEGDGSFFPAEATREFRARAMFEQELQQRFAFFFGHALKRDGERSVHEYAFAAGLGVRANNWVNVVDGVRLGVDVVPQFGRARNVSVGAACRIRQGPAAVERV